MVLPLIGAMAAPLISGAMGLAGGIMQNSAAAAAADKQMDFQERSNAKQMEFQERSARHSYQWAMEDMEKAGLNPILAYKQGGAGTLSGASSSGSSYTPANVGAAAASAAQAGTSSAVAASRNQLELENIAADTRLKENQDKTQTAMQVQAIAQAGQANANSALLTQETQNAFNQEQILRQMIAVNNPKRIIADHDTAFWSSPAAAPLLATRRFFEAISGGGNMINNSAANVARFTGR